MYMYKMVLRNIDSFHFYQSQEINLGKGKYKSSNYLYPEITIL